MFKKILPEDLYLSVLDSYKPSEEDLWRGKVAPDRPARYLSGNEVIDAAVDLLHRNRHQTCDFYAARLGIPLRDLNGFYRVMTGMNFEAWRDRYLVLMAKELLEKTKMSSSEISAWMKFSAVNGFARWFSRLAGRQPIEWRRGWRGNDPRAKYHFDG